LEVNDPMDEKKFEDLMDKWASHEMKAAPDISPTVEVYQKLKDKQKKPRFAVFPRPLRWAAAGIAAAIIILLVVLLPPEERGPTVGLRKGLIEEKKERAEALKEEESPREAQAPTMAQAPRAAEKDAIKRVKKDEIFWGQFIFQYHYKGSKSVDGLDMKVPQDKSITLSSEDNYRLLLELAQERYVSVYQMGPGQSLIRLFPNQEYLSVKNPLRPGQTYILPSPPNWFYAEEAQGEVIIYIIASNEPQQEWDDLYAQYESTEKKKMKKEILSRLINEFTALGKLPAKEAELLVYTFQSQR
jgi:hypothetical protein